MPPKGTGARRGRAGVETQSEVETDKESTTTGIRHQSGDVIAQGPPTLDEQGVEHPDNDPVPESQTGIGLASAAYPFSSGGAIIRTPPNIIRLGLEPERGEIRTAVPERRRAHSLDSAARNSKESSIVLTTKPTMAKYVQDFPDQKSNQAAEAP